MILKTRTKVLALSLGLSIPLVSCKEGEPVRDSLPQESKLGLTGSEEPLSININAIIADASPRIAVFNDLDEQDKMLLYHLNRAARAGHGLLFHQRHRYAPMLKPFFEKQLKDPAKLRKVFKTEEAWKEFTIYAIKFLLHGGPYEAYGNKKYCLKESQKDQLKTLLIEFFGEMDSTVQNNILDLVYNPQFELKQRAGKDDLHLTGGNNYEQGITNDELEKALKDGLKIRINSHVARDGDQLVANVMTVNTPGDVGDHISHVIKELQQAIKYAKTNEQKEQFKSLIQYYEHGYEQDFREQNIHWVKDGNNSTIDFTNGWVEYYEDHKGNIGAYESMIIVRGGADNVASKFSTLANYFEQKMPYGEYKKESSDDRKTSVTVAPYFLELTSARSGGFNLPNYDDIREDHGFKNFIRKSFSEGDAQAVEIRREYFSEYMPATVVDRAVKTYSKARDAEVYLHELIGHGSGTYSKEIYGDNDPLTTLAKNPLVGSLANALEEQRADLTALVFCNDPKLVEIGFYQSQEEAEEVRKGLYDYYLAGYLGFFARMESFDEAHIRGNQLFINYLIEKKAVQWVAKDGSAMSEDNQVLAVANYDAFQKEAENMLSELQRMKATNDAQGIHDLFKKYAQLGDANTSWAQKIIKRGQDLRYKWPSFDQVWDIVLVDEKPVLKTYGKTTLEDAGRYMSRMVN